MPLQLMYITNDPEVALIAERAGVDQIFIDMEFIGKKKRQGGMDTVQLHHTVEDIRKVRGVLSEAQIMVRVNPIHAAGSEDGYSYPDSKAEIDQAIDAGADILMLPYFKRTEEVRQFIEYVDGRAITFPLLETPEAVGRLDEILDLPGLDRIHLGLNDLSLGMKSGFMFGLLADGIVDRIGEKCKEHKIPFGFGGIAGLGKGMLPAEYIIGDHYRLGSQFVILSRSFCNYQAVGNLQEIERIFMEEVPKIRVLEADLERRMADGDKEFFLLNHDKVISCVNMIRNR